MLMLLHLLFHCGFLHSSPHSHYLLLYCYTKKRNQRGITPPHSHPHDLLNKNFFWQRYFPGAPRVSWNEIYKEGTNFPRIYPPASRETLFCYFVVLSIYNNQIIIFKICLLFGHTFAVVVLSLSSLLVSLYEHGEKRVFSNKSFLVMVVECSPGTITAWLLNWWVKHFSLIFPWPVFSIMFKII